MIPSMSNNSLSNGLWQRLREPLTETWWPNSWKIPALFLTLGVLFTLWVALNLASTFVADGPINWLEVTGQLTLGFTWICVGVGELAMKSNLRFGLTLRNIALLIFIPAIIILTMLLLY